MTLEPSAVTDPVACELVVMQPSTPRPPMRPPIRLSAPPLTAPDAFVLLSVPLPTPTRPPTKLAAPPVTFPLALESAILASLLWPLPAVQFGQLMSVALLNPARPPAAP